MRAFSKRFWFWSLLVPALLIGGVGVFYLAHRPPPDRREFHPLQHQWEDAGHERDEAVRTASSAEEKEAARAAYNAQAQSLAERCLRHADKYPDTTGEIAALLMVCKRAPDTPEGKEAFARLLARIPAADLGQLAGPFDWVRGESAPLRPIAPALLARARKDADHPKAARLLTAVCTIHRSREEEEPPPIFAEAADLIADRHADSPELVNFCECFNTLSGNIPWARRYEPHLRKILDANTTRKVRCAAMFAFATIVQAAGESRQSEAESLYARFLEEFDGKHHYEFEYIEQHYRQLAQGQLDEVRHRAAGKPAPEIDGLDLDGKPMRLSEHRGKVVLLNFWATTCFPCLKLVPHERDLVARMAGKPFVLLGVNGDDAVETAKKTSTKHQMTWRSFQDKRATGSTISDEWKVLGLPTLYLIDHKGVVRKRWIGAPTVEELGREVDQLVEQASRKG